MTQPIQPVVLCGGSGTRLWPLSRKTLPKQFVPLIGNKSLLLLTLERLRRLNAEVTCVAAEEHRFLVQEGIDAAQVSGKQLLEPVARNTAAAMAAIALLADPEQLLLFAPADHHIPDAERFVATIRKGIPAALAGYLVTFGVEPTFPSTAYGYIRQGDKLDDALGDGSGPCGGRIHREARRRARRAVAARRRPSLERRHPAGAGQGADRRAGGARARHPRQSASSPPQPVEVDGDFLRMDSAAFGRCRSQSIDYAVLEKCDRVAVIPFQGRWSDVGSWNAVADLHDMDANGNRISGHGFAMGASNTFIHAPRPARSWRWAPRTCWWSTRPTRCWSRTTTAPNRSRTWSRC